MSWLAAAVAGMYTIGAEYSTGGEEMALRALAIGSCLLALGFRWLEENET